MLAAAVAAVGAVAPDVHRLGVVRCGGGGLFDFDVAPVAAASPF